MRTSNTFSILFWVNYRKATNGQVLIYVQITVNQKRVNISLKRKVSIDLWEPKKKRARGNSVEAKQINQYLDLEHSKLFQCYQDLKFKGKLITAKLIKENYLGEGENSKTLQNLMEYHNRKIEYTLAPGTIRNFNVTEGYINKFLNQERKTSDVYLKHLDYKFLCDFENYLQGYWPKGHPKAMGNNTVMKHIQRLRKIVTLAFHLEWTDKDPFRRWKPTSEKREREFLSANELSNLETYPLPLERLERVRDLFVFSCYTGISYVDIMSLSIANVALGVDGNNWIITKRQKNQNPYKSSSVGSGLRSHKKIPGIVLVKDRNYER